MMLLNLQSGDLGSAFQSPNVRAYCEGPFCMLECNPARVAYLQFNARSCRSSFRLVYALAPLHSRPQAGFARVYDAVHFFYAFVFCATSATIFAGAVAERTHLAAYLLFK